MTPEKDPLGKSQHAPGAKMDAGKVRMHLITGGMARALTEVAKVGTMGAAKYTDGGWTEVPDGFRRYEDAQQRHAALRHMGEELDKESGLLHLAHEAWNALAKLDLYLRGNEPKTPPVKLVEPTSPVLVGSMLHDALAFLRAKREEADIVEGFGVVPNTAPMPKASIFDFMAERAKIIAQREEEAAKQELVEKVLAKPTNAGAGGHGLSNFVILYYHPGADHRFTPEAYYAQAATLKEALLQVRSWYPKAEIVWSRQVTLFREGHHKAVNEYWNSRIPRQ